MKKSGREPNVFQSRFLIDFGSLLVPKMTSFWTPWFHSGLLRATFGVVLVTNWMQTLKYHPKVLPKCLQSHQNEIQKSSKWGLKVEKKRRNSKERSAALAKRLEIINDTRFVECCMWLVHHLYTTYTPLSSTLQTSINLANLVNFR